MLFTITYTGENATDLGYLLHKNPSRPQTAVFNFGKAHIFYPEASVSRCTAALLLDINPIDLTRGRSGSQNRFLFDYVNDRPYVCSSFMSTAISRVYGTAMAGRCDKRQNLADTVLDLSITLTMLPCRGNTAMLEKVFAPLGYELSWEEFPLDEHFPEWGLAPYVNLSLQGKQRLMGLLRHIYVLIPVFDFQKHYWIGEDEVDKLLSHGKGWLENHPEKNFITRRYFTRVQRYTHLALKRMDNGESGSASFKDVSSLNNQRMSAILTELKARGAESVIDLGCGEGNLLFLLMKEKCFSTLAGSDISLSALDRAAERLKVESPQGTADLAVNELVRKKRLSLFQGSLCYRDKRFKGYDAAVIAEVIEHLDKSRLPIFSSVIFGDAAPKTVIITTPNREYNIKYQCNLRHPDHRFEWNRTEFRTWAEAVAALYGYSVRIEEIGEFDEELGSPTQMGVFTKITNKV